MENKRKISEEPGVSIIKGQFGAEKPNGERISFPVTHLMWGIRRVIISPQGMAFDDTIVILN